MRGKTAIGSESTDARQRLLDFIKENKLVGVWIQHLRFPVAYFHQADFVQVFDDSAPVLIFDVLYIDLSIKEIRETLLNLNVFKCIKLFRFY